MKNTERILESIMKTLQTIDNIEPISIFAKELIRIEILEIKTKLAEIKKSSEL
jgi:hypothetical protein